MSAARSHHASADADPRWVALIDDAAVFPPGNASVADAVERHTEHRRACYAPYVGPLLLPVAAVGTFLEEVAKPDREVPHVGLAVRPGTATMPEVAQAVTRIHDHGAARVVGVEMAVPGDTDQVSGVKLLTSQASAVLPADVMLWLELRADEDISAATDFIAATDLNVGAKYRMGGISAADFPSIEQVAHVLYAAARSGGPLKLTAGLHHLHRFDDTELGCTHHGFGNVMAAVHTGLTALTWEALLEPLAQRNPDITNRTLAELEPRQVDGVRSVLRSFGCCGVTDPIDDLIAAGLLSAPDERQPSR